MTKGRLEGGVKSRGPSQVARTHRRNVHSTLPETKFTFRIVTALCIHFCILKVEAAFERGPRAQLREVARNLFRLLARWARSWS